MVLSAFAFIHQDGLMMGLGCFPNGTPGPSGCNQTLLVKLLYSKAWLLASGSVPIVSL